MASSAEIAEQYAGKVRQRKEALRGLVDTELGENSEQETDALFQKIQEFMKKQTEQNNAVVDRMKNRLKEQNAEMQALTDQNAAIKEHLTQVQAAFDRLKELADQQGMGKEIDKLVQASGLNDYLCRKVFLRLYEDALRRIDRRSERAKKAFEEKGKEMAMVQDCVDAEFAASNCAFLRVQGIDNIKKMQTRRQKSGQKK